MAAPTAFSKFVSEILAVNEDALGTISKEIHSHPETKFEEFFAHDLLCDFLEKRNFTVTRAYKDVKTAFCAEFTSANFDKKLHATVSVLCEYDALPEIGHACGHNLIAEAGIATGLAIQAILKNEHGLESIQGKLVIMGTPAEEGGGGKVDLIRAGAFKDVDVSMMVHPFANNDLEPIILGRIQCKVEFYGKAAHASCGPWEGVNALDAAVAAYHNVALYRQQMKPTWRVHSIISNGGAKPNIIPDLTVCQYYVRAQTQVDLEFLKTKVVNILNAAASATGCTLKIEWETTPYTGMMHNSTMSALYKKFAVEEGIVFPEHIPGFNGSTDMGNVSLEVPSIHPGYFIGEKFMIHTRDFEQLAGSNQAQKYTFIAAKSMALTSLEILRNPELRTKIKEEFNQKKKLFVG